MLTVNKTEKTILGQHTKPGPHSPFEDDIRRDMFFRVVGKTVEEADRAGTKGVDIPLLLLPPKNGYRREIAAAFGLKRCRDILVEEVFGLVQHRR